MARAWVLVLAIVVTALPAAPWLAERRPVAFDGDC